MELQPAAVDLDDARQFRQAQHFAVGDVANWNFADERYQMMLAHGEHLDILDDDHLVVILVEHSVVEDL